MSTRGKRVRTLLRVASVRRKQSEAALAKARVDQQRALVRQAETVERLREAAPVPAGSVSSLDARRQRTDLRIDAVLDAGEAVAASSRELDDARLRWQAAARNEKSMEELDRRERAVQAVKATRMAERAVDDALRARRSSPAGGNRS
jgi:hypothetical protein